MCLSLHILMWVSVSVRLPGAKMCLLAPHVPLATCLLQCASLASCSLRMCLMYASEDVPHSRLCHDLFHICPICPICPICHMALYDICGCWRGVTRDMILGAISCVNKGDIILVPLFIIYQSHCNILQHTATR